MLSYQKKYSTKFDKKKTVIIYLFLLTRLAIAKNVKMIEEIVLYIVIEFFLLK